MNRVVLTHQMLNLEKQCRYLVRKDEDVDDVENGAEHTDGYCQVAVNVLIRLQQQKLHAYFHLKF